MTADPVTTLATPTFRDLSRRLGGMGDGIVPMVLFVVVNAVGGLVWAIGAATAAAAIATVHRMVRQQRVSPLVWVTLGFLLLRGLAGILTRSDTVYFGPSVLFGFVIGLAFAGSLVAGKPVIGVLTNGLYPLPSIARQHVSIHATFMRLTAMWAVYIFVATIVQLWLLAALSASGFVVARAAWNWCTTPVLIAITLRSMRRVMVTAREVVATS